MYDIQEITNRLRAHYGCRGLKELSKKMGVKYQTLTTWVQRNKIPFELLHKIAQNENISFEWLLTGEGFMHKEYPSKTIDTTTVNFYEDIYASAGYGASNHTVTPQQMPISTFLLQTLGIASADDIDIIRITGDSMEPHFPDGSFAIILRTPDTTHIRNGDTVIANIAGDIYIKQIEKIPFQDSLILRSTNPLYEDIRIQPEQLDQLTIIGVAKGVLKAF